MNPNEQPQQPQAPAAQPPQPTPDFQAQPQPEPFAPAQPEQAVPVQPLSPNTAPVAPVMSEAPVQPAPTQYAAPQPQQPYVQPQPGPLHDETGMKPKKSHKKLVVLIAAIVAGLAVLGAGIWLAISMMSSIPLKTYENESYSILVPEGYEENISSGFATFTATSSSEVDGEVSGGSAEAVTGLLGRSSVVIIPVQTGPIGGSAEYLKMIDGQSDSDIFENDSFRESNTELRDTVRTSVDHSGHEARKISAAVYRDGVLSGHFMFYYLVADESTMYLVYIISQKDTPGLYRSAEKIIDSFTIK